VILLLPRIESLGQRFAANCWPRLTQHMCCVNLAVHLAVHLPTNRDRGRGTCLIPADGGRGTCLDVLDTGRPIITVHDSRLRVFSWSQSRTRIPSPVSRSRCAARRRMLRPLLAQRRVIRVIRGRPRHGAALVVIRVGRGRPMLAQLPPPKGHTGAHIFIYMRMQPPQRDPPLQTRGGCCGCCVLQPGLLQHVRPVPAGPALLASVLPSRPARAYPPRLLRSCSPARACCSHLDWRARACPPRQGHTGLPSSTGLTPPVAPPPPPPPPRRVQWSAGMGAMVVQWGQPGAELETLVETRVGDKKQTDASVWSRRDKARGRERDTSLEHALAIHGNPCFNSQLDKAHDVKFTMTDFDGLSLSA
jgi:hypothetical protein